MIRRVTLAALAVAVFCGVGIQTAGAATYVRSSGFYHLTIPNNPEGYCRTVGTVPNGVSIQMTPNSPTVVGRRLSNGYNTTVYELLSVKDLDTGGTVMSSFSAYSVGNWSYRLPSKSITINRPYNHRLKVSVYLAWVDPISSRIVGDYMYTVDQYNWNSSGADARGFGYATSTC